VHNKSSIDFISESINSNNTQT